MVSTAGKGSTAWASHSPTRHVPLANGRTCPPQQPSSNLAKDVYLWDCKILEATNTLQLFALNENDEILVKLQRESRMDHVAREMKHEAEMYEYFGESDLFSEITPRFLGYRDHLGVAMSCFERELDDFEDIGIENLSAALRESALKAVMALSREGVLHNDLALRNIVQSRDDLKKHKIIDFGRATFCDEEDLLAEQVETAKALLCVGSIGYG